MIMDLIYYCCYRMKPPETERLIDRFEELAEHEIERILKKYNCVKNIAVKAPTISHASRVGDLFH